MLSDPQRTGTRRQPLGGFLQNLIIGVSVIKINSFIPTDNLTRRSWEFYDNYLVVKTKSLSFEYENEVEYEKIKSIRSRSMREFNWIWTSFITVGLVGIANLGLDYFCVTNPLIDYIEKIVTTFALAML